MTEDDKTPADAATKLRADLRALLRQRDQYALAMDAATDPKVSIRLQRTLERIEEEIEGLEEAVASLPEDPPPEAAEALPDWDEEPSTSIYDPEKIQLHLEKLSAGATPEPAPEPAPEPEAATPAASAGSEFDEEATIALPSGGLEQLRLEAEAADAKKEHAVAAAEALPSQGDAPHADVEPPPTAAAPQPAPTPEPAPHPAVAPVSQDEPAEEESNPLGPVWMDGLSPATEELPREMAAKLIPQAPGEALDGVADDPFAMPGQAAPASGAATVTTGGGFPASPFDNLSNPVSVLDDDVSSDWGFGAKAALFVGVAGFLAGVFYVLSIN